MGTARFVDDVRPDEFGSPFVHAAAVTSTIAGGRITAIDASEAMAVPGSVSVMTHENAPRLKTFFSPAMAETAERLPLQDDRVLWHGECVAVVVAKTLAAARRMAGLVRVTYEAGEPVAVTLDDGADRLETVKRAGIAPGGLKKGDAEADFAAAPVKIDARYRTSPHHHNAMETGAVIARWDEDGGVTIRAAVQWHHIETMAIGKAFGLGFAEGVPGFLARKVLGRSFEGRVRLTNTLAGGAFGRNLNTQHLFLACMAAKVADQAVKLTLTRAQTYSMTSYRAEVDQRMRLGADRDGRLTTILHEPDVAVGRAGQFVEPVGMSPMQVYAHRSHLLRHRVAKLDLNGAGWMRAPGNSAGLFALETAMDELAHAVGIDPLELRLRNHADHDPQTAKPWQHKALRARYERGAEAFGWHARAKGGTADADGRIVGHGMASVYEYGFRFPATAGVRLRGDGTASIEATVAEMGQGTWTGLRAISAETMGLPEADIHLDTDGTALPAGAGSVASTGTLSNATSIIEAADAVKAELKRFAIGDAASPLHGLRVDEIEIVDGQLVGPGNRRESVAAAMGRHPGEIHHTATTGRDFGRSKSRHAAFGAIFAAVSLDPVTLALRVERMVGAFDCGRTIEPTIAEGQLAGSMIWGLGQALMEETRLDRRTGAWTNDDLGEALVPTCADVRSLQVIAVEDEHAESGPLAMKGASELAVPGPAAAIGNAVFDAIGVRHRSLPMRIEERVALYGEANA